MRGCSLFCLSCFSSCCNAFVVLDLKVEVGIINFCCELFAEFIALEQFDDDADADDEVSPGNNGDEGRLLQLLLLVFIS